MWQTVFFQQSDIFGPNLDPDFPSHTASEFTSTQCLPSPMLHLTETCDRSGHQDCSPQVTITFKFPHRMPTWDLQIPLLSNFNLSPVSPQLSQAACVLCHPILSCLQWPVGPRVFPCPPGTLLKLSLVAETAGCLLVCLLPIFLLHRHVHTLEELIFYNARNKSTELYQS